MEKVNYISHLNEAFERINDDIRIKQGHITLYMAFFQKWNREFFKATITVNRGFIMERAKFRSKTTYHNYLKDLNDWGYLQYFPSFHPARGSRIKMTNFCTSTGVGSGQKLANSVPEPGQTLVPSKNLKQKENFNKLATPKNELEVLSFFKINNWPAIEGKKFYAYYQSKNWKLSRGLEIKNWRESAKNFVEHGFKIKQVTTSPISGYVDRLRNNNKDYGIPL